MMRAERGEDSIELAVAMKYLKATKFDSDKALDIYKNYQVYMHCKTNYWLPNNYYTCMYICALYNY